MNREFSEASSSKPLTTVPALLDASHHDPVLIFKHSTQCNISDAALRVVRNLLRTWPGVVFQIVPVQEARALSDEIQRRLGIAHQTPQVLILRFGKVAWHGSPFSLTTHVLKSLGDAA